MTLFMRWNTLSVLKSVGTVMPKRKLVAWIGAIFVFLASIAQSFAQTTIVRQTTGAQLVQVATGHPIAAAAGMQIFKPGENGVDAAIPSQEATDPATDCTMEGLQTKAPRGTTITSATLVAPSGKLPQYCRVDGHSSSEGNEVNFRLGLPSRWNGKFYFVGVGGLAGTIGPLDKGLLRGYASASTDTGHEAGDPNWGSNRAKEIDYGHRGTHVAAVAAKALTATYFGRPLSHAYFEGCSNGGRQALMESQRYPTDFDGIIAGDPSTGTAMQAGRALLYQHMLLHPENYLPFEKVELLSQATVAACDALDGLKDGLVSDPRLCKFKPETLKCPDADSPECLTAGQLETVKRIYGGVKVPTGESFVAGFPMGHEGGATGWQTWIVGSVPPTLQPDGTLAYGSAAPSAFRLSEANMRYLALDKDDPDFSWKTFRFPQDLPRLQTMAEILSPLDPDLKPFKGAGGESFSTMGGRTRQSVPMARSTIIRR